MVEIRVTWDALELVNEGHWVGWLSGGDEILDTWVWLEPQLEGEVGGGFPGTILPDFTEVTESNILDELSGGCELLSKSLGGEGTGWWNMVLEGSGEEVPVTWLSFDALHGNEIGRVNSIPEELQAHSWSECVASKVWLCSRGESNKTIVGPSEDTGISTSARWHKFDLADCTNGVDKLGPSSQAQELWHGVTSGFEGLLHSLEEDSGDVWVAP